MVKESLYNEKTRPKEQYMNFETHTLVENMGISNYRDLIRKIKFITKVKIYEIIGTSQRPKKGRDASIVTRNVTTKEVTKSNI